MSIEGRARRPRGRPCRLGARRVRPTLMDHAEPPLDYWRVKYIDIAIAMGRRREI